MQMPLQVRPHAKRPVTPFHIRHLIKVAGGGEDGQASDASDIGRIFQPVVQGFSTESAERLCIEWYESSRRLVELWAEVAANRSEEA